MSMDKPQKTLADYVAIAISPALIMALVGSLVFFLLEIVYVGQYEGSLQYILFFFVFGAVLVSRISMGETAERAPLYGIVLGLVTWIALLKFVEYPEDSPLAPWAWAINLGLIAVIWWSAHRLTWDCTLIDEDVDASGAGLLEVAGFERQSAGAQEHASAEHQGAERAPRSRAPALTWFQRYVRYREERRKQPHAPGVWVVYFSLAALPLFGLGQSQIPPQEESRRQYAFQLMAIYVGSGLGLLLTTSFLGLRRYLRQRKLRMPAGITMAWLTLGAILIALVLGFGAILPHPGAPHPLLEWTGLGSRNRETSRLAQVGKGNKPTKDEKGAQIKGKAKDEKDQGTDKKGDTKSKANGKEADEKNDNTNSKGKDQDPEKKGKEEKENASGGKNQEKDKKDDKAGSKREQAKAPPASSAGSFFNKLAGILKWIVFGILILVFLFVLLRSGLRWLANFTLWAQRLLAALSAWWNSLGALWKRSAPADAESIPKEKPPPMRPFSSYSDPFLYGEGETMSVRKLIRYSFEALEAWARARDLGRNHQETPLEFAQRLAGVLPELDKDLRRLANYYGGLAYAEITPGASCREAVRVFWQKLGEVVEKPTSEAHV
jgi:chromatin remodeling complex protein RSC6